MRDWVNEIRMEVIYTRGNYEGKELILQMSEPLKDLMIELATITTSFEKSDVGGDREHPEFFDCKVVVSDKISTYRIFAECISGDKNKKNY